MQLGTIVSVYGCWRFLNKPLIHNVAKDEFMSRDVEETMSTNLNVYQEKEAKGSIKLESRYLEEEFRHRAGFWGYLMQTIYQVGQTHQIQCYQWKITMKNVTMCRSSIV